jgi:hypothetical protein
MDTSETDALYERLLTENPGNLIYLAEMLHHARQMERERDEARAELAEWTDSAKNVRKEYDDEHHCSCVPILRKLLKDAERERDEWAAMCGRYKQERDEARLDKRGG